MPHDPGREPVTTPPYFRCHTLGRLALYRDGDEGKPIMLAGKPLALLAYLVSFRNHDGVHEHCVERIFCDLRARCRPTALTVFARYTRRGGIDINPFRSDFETLTENVPAWRQ